MAGLFPDPSNPNPGTFLDGPPTGITSGGDFLGALTGIDPLPDITAAIDKAASSLAPPPDGGLGFDSVVSTLGQTRPLIAGTAAGVFPGPTSPAVRQKGVIFNSTAGGDGKRYVLPFLFFPNEIQEQHQIGGNAPIPQQDINPAITGGYNGPSSSSLTFNLLFDRSIEVWRGAAQGPTAAGKGLNPGDQDAVNAATLGAMVDVRRLYDIVGIGWATPGGGRTVTPRTVMVSQFVWVVFGADRVGTSVQAYYGRITDASVTWTYWSQESIPTRCAMGINLQLYPVPDGGGQ